VTRPSLIAAARAAPLVASGGLAEPLAGWAAPCLEVLNLEQPRAVRAAHAAYLAAGARVVRTNTAAASPERLDRWRMHDEAFIVSYMAAEHAAESVRVAERESGVPCWTLGVARVEARLNRIGFLPLERVETAARTMASGLAGGGADAILVESNQDGARLTAALDGVRRGMADAGRSLPVLLTLRYDALFAPPHSGRVTGDLARAAAAAAGLGVAALAVANADLAEGWAATLRTVARAFPGPLFAEAAPGSPDLAELLADPALAPRLALLGGGAAPADTARLCRLLQNRPSRPPAAVAAACNDTLAAPLRRPKGTP